MSNLDTKLRNEVLDDIIISIPLLVAMALLAVGSLWIFNSESIVQLIIIEFSEYS